MLELAPALPLTELREHARARLLALYKETRARTESYAARVSPEDQQVQSMPDASPTKWHRAHTTWFFETFMLAPAGVDVVDRRYGPLFNSYYEGAGPRLDRAKRGVLSRPSASEVADYRRIVDARVTRLVGEAGAASLDRLLPILELGIAHEEQHQELLLTDILHAFSENPLRPAFVDGDPAAASGDESSMRFVPFAGGLCEIGAPATASFAFDNEAPRHKVWLEPFELADRLVTVGELKAFLREGGYRTPSLWLAEGYDFVRACELSAPFHSRYVDGELLVFTLAGECVAADSDPAVHVTFYEADAIATFFGARLPTEAEWEVVAATHDAARGRFADEGRFRPRAAPGVSEGAGGVRQLYGDAWEWMRSSYEPYPGYEAPAGVLGEYNGKFMVNQRVLRGGSCLTVRRHVRPTYRNFWNPPTQFQMTGIRLARGGRP
jgi:ergothioneine biosynthesis protein EgtB